MRRIVSLFLVCAAAVVAACSDVSAPASRSIGVVSPSFAASRGDCGDPTDFGGGCFGDPPPPPSDTSMYGSNANGETTGRIGVTYFYNKPGNTGWVSFSKSQVAGVDVSPNARLSYQQGVMTGKGTIAISQPGGKYVIDLSKSTFVNVQFNASCSKTCGAFGIISPERNFNFIIGPEAPRGDRF